MSSPQRFAADMDAPDEGPTVGNPGRAKSRRWLGVIAVCAALLAAGYGAVLLVGHHQREVAAEQALDAARQYALTLTNVDADSIDRDFTDIAAGSTVEFQRMHTQSRKTLRRMIVDADATARGTVVDAVIKSATENRVVVVLLIDQSVTNRDVPEPQIDRSRIRMTMDRVDGQWLASKVELL